MLTSNTPVVKTQYNIWDLLGAEIVNGDNPQMISNLRSGYKDAEGTITWYETDRIVLSGETLQTEWSKAPVGDTIYGAVVNAIIGYLISIGKIPVDATEYVAE